MFRYDREIKKLIREIERLINKFGRSLKIVEANTLETPIKAFMQPLRYKNKMYLSSISTDLCYDSTTKYLLICPAHCGAENADGYIAYISDGENKYIVDRCEDIYLSDNPMYSWAIVTRL